MGRVSVFAIWKRLSGSLVGCLDTTVDKSVGKLSGGGCGGPGAGFGGPAGGFSGNNNPPLSLAPLMLEAERRTF